MQPWRNDEWVRRLAVFVLSSRSCPTASLAAPSKLVHPLILPPAGRWNNRIASASEVPKKNREGDHNAIILQFGQNQRKCFLVRISRHNRNTTRQRQEYQWVRNLPFQPDGNHMI